MRPVTDVQSSHDIGTLLVPQRGFRRSKPYDRTHPRVGACRLAPDVGARQKSQEWTREVEIRGRAPRRYRGRNLWLDVR